MATQRYFRLVSSPAQAQQDLLRGTSLHQTHMTDPREPLYDHLPAERVDDMDQNEARERLTDLGYIEVETGWALVLDGLCGFDASDAIRAAVRMDGYDRGLAEFVAVFEGSPVGDYDGLLVDEGGEIFRPTALLAVVERAAFDPLDWQEE